MSSGKPAPESISRFGRRTLTTDEEHLWSLVVRTVRPLQRGRKPATAAPHKPVIRDAPPAKKKTAVYPEAGSPHQRIVSKRTAPKHASPVPALPAIMRREKQQLARGRMTIDARIDLHGMTQSEAHNALRRFLLRCQANGAKFVLVITGKGAPNAPHAERGILRQQVPLWLALPEFSRYAVGFDVAHTGDGGHGALYVRLRRARG